MSPNPTFWDGRCNTEVNPKRGRCGRANVIQPNIHQTEKPINPPKEEKVFCDPQEQENYKVKGFFKNILEKFGPLFDGKSHKVEKGKRKEEREQKIVEIQAMLEGFTKKEVKTALKQAEGDKEKAIIILLDSK